MGTSTRSPQNPYITEGIPAMRSIIFCKKIAILPFLKYSPNSIAVDIEKGRLIKRERKDVIKVPTRNGRIPNLLLTGSQSEERIKLTPMCFKTGKELMNKVMHIPAAIKITVDAHKKIRNLKILSLIPSISL